MLSYSNARSFDGGDHKQYKWISRQLHGVPPAVGAPVFTVCINSATNHPTQETTLRLDDGTNTSPILARFEPRKTNILFQQTRPACLYVSAALFPMMDLVISTPVYIAQHDLILTRFHFDVVTFVYIESKIRAHADMNFTD